MKRRNKIFLWILASIVVLIGGFYLALIHLGLLEYIANRELRNRVEEDFALKVRIGDIAGDYFSGLILKDIDIIYDDGIETYTMARIPKLFLEYSLAQLWRGRLIFERITIDSAEFTIKKSSEQEWLIPSLRKAVEGKGLSLDFKVYEFNLNNLRFSLVTPDDTLSFKNIVLQAHIEALENTYSALFEGFSYRSSDARFNLVSAGGKVTLTGNQLMFQDLTLVTDSSNVRIAGQITLDRKFRTTIGLNAERLSLTELSSFLNADLKGSVSATGFVEYEAGRLAANMTIAGTFMDRDFDSLGVKFSFYDGRLDLDTVSGFIFDGCHIEGKGGIDFSTRPEAFHLTAFINNFNLDNLVYDTYTSDLNGEIDLTGRGFSSDDLALDIVADLGESWFDEYRAHKVEGHMTITTDSIIFHDRFVVKYYDNAFIVGGKLDYDGAINLSGDADFRDLSAFNGQTFIERMGGCGELTFKASGELKNPDVSGLFKSDSLWIYDIFSREAMIRFDVDRFLFDREGYIDQYLFDGVAYNVPYDTIRLKIHVDSQYVRIDSLSMNNEHVHATGTGNLDYVSYPQLLTLDDIRIELLGLSFKNDDPIVIGIDSSGYDFVDCRLRRPAGFIGGKGRINYDESMDFYIFTDRIDIAPWIKLYFDEYEIRGSISGSAELSGSFRSPHISFHGWIDSLQFQNLVLGDLIANLEYFDETVHIDSATLKSELGYYIASGEFPVNLAFISAKDRFPDRTQDIRITATDKRFDPVTLLVEQVEDFTGELQADLRLYGTPLKPKLDGEASVREGRLKIYDLVLPLEDLHVDIKMINQTVYIDSLSAVCRNGRKGIGNVLGSGEVVVKSIGQFDYNVNVGLEQFPVKYELGDIYALIDARLAVRGVTPPTVYGNVDIIAATYRENFAAADEGWIVLSSIQGEHTWDLNLNVEAKSNLWIKNDDIDAEFAGALNFIREKGRFRYIGSMQILRGKGFWADRTFRIEPGGLISYEDIEYPDPRLDILASTRIRGATLNQFGEMETTNLDLRVRVTGTLDEPIINAAEGSQFSTEDILPLIFLNFYQGDSSGVGTGERFGDRLTAGVSGYLSSQVGRIGARTLGVETFEIDPVYGDKFDPLGTRLTLGFYTHPNLYVYGRSTISGEAGQEVGFEYRFERFLLMEGRLDEDNLYRLLLNFYWDY